MDVSDVLFYRKISVSCSSAELCLLPFVFVMHSVHLCNSINDFSKKISFCICKIM